MYRKFNIFGIGYYETPVVDYVTVGHAGSGADYICDGTSDQTEIISALGTGKEVRIIGDGTPYNVISINLPSSSAVQKITAYNPAVPPILKASTGGIILSAGTNKFDISYIKFDGNAKQCQCISFDGGSSDSLIHHNEFYGYLQTSWDLNCVAVYGTDANVYIHNNIVHDFVGMGFWIVGKTDPTNAGSYCPIAYNHIYAGKSYNASQLSAIFGKHLSIHHNTVHNFGNKTDDYATAGGGGISASRSYIGANVVRGCAVSGITPISYTDIADDCYCLVDSNCCQYNGANGIDFWYSDGSTITNNICCDNGQHGDPNSWDADGIDVCDHSGDCIISYNICANWQGGYSDTLSSSAPEGQIWIPMSAITKWYDVQNGYNCPFDGLGITIGAAINRIDYADIANSRLYLLYAVPAGGYASGATVTGRRMQQIGINIADNSQSLGGHRGTGNQVAYNNNVQIWPTINGSCLPNTCINGYGNAC